MFALFSIWPKSSLWALCTRNLLTVSSFSMFDHPLPKFFQDLWGVYVNYPIPRWLKCEFYPQQLYFHNGENFSRSTLWTNLSNIFLTSNKSSVRCVNQSSLCETFTTEKKLVRESLYSTISSASVLFSQTFFCNDWLLKILLKKKEITTH